jgi:hypothetical protein
MKITIWKSGEHVATVDLQPGEYAVGRSEAAHIVLEHPSCSRRHATIAVAADFTVSIVDTGSAQGTYKDGVEIAAHQPTPLQDGAKVHFGASSRLYLIEAPARPPPAAPPPAAAPLPPAAPRVPSPPPIPARSPALAAAPEPAAPSPPPPTPTVGLQPVPEHLIRRHYKPSLQPAPAATSQYVLDPLTGQQVRRPLVTRLRSACECSSP